MKTKNKIFIGVGAFFGLFLILVIMVAIFPPEGSARRTKSYDKSIIEKHIRYGIKTNKMLTVGEDFEDVGSDFVKDIYYKGAIMGIAMGKNKGELSGFEMDYKGYSGWAVKIAREDAEKYKTLRNNTSNAALYNKYNENYTMLESAIDLIEKEGR